MSEKLTGKEIVSGGINPDYDLKGITHGLTDILIVEVEMDTNTPWGETVTLGDWYVSNIKLANGTELNDEELERYNEDPLLEHWRYIWASNANVSLESTLIDRAMDNEDY